MEEKRHGTATIENEEMTRNGTATIENDEMTRHGTATIENVKSIPQICVDLKLLAQWQTNAVEGTKGLDYPPEYASDVKGHSVLPDGLILSAGLKNDWECLNYTNQEIRDRTSKHDFDWRTYAVPVKPGDEFSIKWQYTAKHKTRGYDWRLAKTDFNFRLKWKDFEKKPFSAVYNGDTPFWEYDLEPQQQLTVKLPNRAPGYYVLLHRWIIADTANAFHTAWVIKYES